MELPFDFGWTIQNGTISPSGANGITYLQLLQQVKAALGGAAAQATNATPIKKFRVTSIIVPPLSTHFISDAGAAIGSLTNVTTSVVFLMSGDRYSSGNADGSIRIKLSNAWGKPGMWLLNDQGTPATTDLIAGSASAWGDQFLSLSATPNEDDVHYSTKVQIRVAWTD